MDNDRAAKRTAWFKAHPHLQASPSMLRRHEEHDYTSRCVYLFTITVKQHRQLLGTLQPADDSHPSPWVQPSALGKAVIEQWTKITIEHPIVKSMTFQLMPDHVHGILFVTSQLERHVGHLIGRFKAKTTAAMRNLSAYSETQSRTSTLWEPNYNDRILAGKGQLERWARYVQDNPRRLWAKRHHREWFTARKGLIIGDTPVTTMGNQFLLDYPSKVVVQCSRRMTEQDIEKACQRYLSLAQGGAILVSACISPGEKRVMKCAFEAGFPQIILLENGFAPMQKPAGRQFDACSEGRLLLVAPWGHHNDRHVITRQQCLALNRLASEITGG